MEEEREDASPNYQCVLRNNSQNQKNYKLRKCETLILRWNYEKKITFNTSSFKVFFVVGYEFIFC